MRAGEDEAALPACATSATGIPLRDRLLTQPRVVCRAFHLDNETVDDAIHVELVGLHPRAVTGGAKERADASSGVAKANREPFAVQNSSAQFPPNRYDRGSA